jgi:hypothetical protein
MENALRQNFFRAGHAHAGVFVILSLVCQLLADGATLPEPLLWVARIGVPLAAILLPMGFFLSMTSPVAVQPNGFVVPCCRGTESGRWSAEVINPVEYLFLTGTPA